MAGIWQKDWGQKDGFLIFLPNFMFPHFSAPHLSAMIGLPRSNEFIQAMDAAMSREFPR
jgi:hypothetical protein